MLRDVEPPDPMKQSLKRAREDHPETITESEHQQRRLKTSPSTHSPAQQGKPMPELPELQPGERQPVKQQDNWFIDHWQSKTAQEPATPGTLEGQQTLLGSRDVPPFEDNNSFSSVERPCDWQDEGSDQMSQSQDAGSSLSKKLETGRPIYRVALKMNNVTIDNDGSEIPREVEEVVTKHIRKKCTSARLEDEKKAEILNAVKLVWDESESTLTDLTALPILPFGNVHHRPPKLVHGGNTLWSRAPPQSALFPLVTPKTDKHLGYPNLLLSTWTPQELMAVAHPLVRPYSQPTTSNIFPSFLCEVKSEATGGTIYAAEAQLATAGFHRVKSMIWILDQIDPQRTRKSTDAIVFSAALSQRQLVAYVHYYDPVSDAFRMSFVDSFYLFKEVQGCMDFSRNVEDWMLHVQQPAVREAMKRFHPVTKLWTKGRPASVVAADDVASFGGDGDNGGGRTAKNARTE